MVALAVPQFGQRPVVCGARPLLFKAHASLERGRVVEAACQLREAMRLYLAAEMQFHSVTLKKSRDMTPATMSKALRRAKVMGPGVCEWCLEIIDYCNKVVHCQFVRRGLIAASIEITFELLDGSPYLIDAATATGGGR